MKHNKLIGKLLNQFAGDSPVFFKTPDSPVAIPVAYHMYEVDNTLVFFKSEDNSAATINNLLAMINDNYYTGSEGEGEDEDFMVAISNITDWFDDKKGFSNMLSIIDAIQIDNKVILTTKPFYEDAVDEASQKLTIVSTDRNILNKFIEEVDELKNSIEFNNFIHIF